MKELTTINEKELINGCANITGGGLVDNIQRIIPNNLCAEIDLNNIKTLKIFKWLYKMGVSEDEMLKTFNCGVGFCLIVNPLKFKLLSKYFGKKFKPYVIGKIIKIQKSKIKWKNILVKKKLLFLLVVEVVTLKSLIKYSNKKILN